MGADLTSLAKAVGHYRHAVAAFYEEGETAQLRRKIEQWAQVVIDEALKVVPDAGQ